MKKVYVVYTNELRYSVVKIFRKKDKALKFISDGNGLYLNCIDEFELQ